MLLRGYQLPLHVRVACMLVRRSASGLRLGARSVQRRRLNCTRACMRHEPPECADANLCERESLAKQGIRPKQQNRHRSQHRDRHCVIWPVIKARAHVLQGRSAARSLMEKEWKVLRVSAGCMLPRVHPARGSRASGWRLHKGIHALLGGIGGLLLLLRHVAVHRTPDRRNIRRSTEAGRCVERMCASQQARGEPDGQREVAHIIFWRSSIIDRRCSLVEVVHTPSRDVRF